MKPLVWAARRSKGPTRLGLILGSQRSGTNMLNDAFDRDWNCMAFGEDSGLALGTSVEHHLRWRWRPLDEVASILSHYRAPLLIAKPIVESQRVRELMEFFPDATIIWAYRHFQDVAQSSIVMFGWEASLYNLTSVLNPERSSHWFSENATEETRAVVRKYFDPARSLPDLKALSWYVRNSLFFQFDLASSPRVTLCKYEKMVAAPVEEMRRLYAFLDTPFPGPMICDHMHQSSVRKGRDVAVSNDIRSLCENMLARLDEVHVKKTSNFSS
jgi:hypothetical protein